MIDKTDLTHKKCVPCEGGTKPLEGEKLQEYMHAVGGGWELFDENKKIRKEFTFKDFKEAIEFINRVAEIAIIEDHHPDITLFSYKKVRIELFTHAIGGLSENDFILAAKIEGLL